MAQVPEWWGRIDPIVAYRDIYGTPPGSAAAALLDRLEHDDRMRETWTTFAKHCPHPNAWARLIFSTLEAYTVAAQMRDVPAARGRIESECEALAACADRLVAWFAEDAESAPEREAIAIGHEVHGRAKEVVESCRWAAQFLRELPRPMIERLDALPNSRKRDNPVLAFAVMLATALDHETGQPLYEVVAVIADVIFATGEPLTAEAIRKARGRDLARARDQPDGSQPKKPANRPHTGA